MSSLDDPKLKKILAREHALAKGDDARWARVRGEIDAAKAAGGDTSALTPKDVYLAVQPAMGVFLNLCARSLGARIIVEFGTSFGISTLYLAAAARDTGGFVTGSELEPSKAARARENLREAGLAEHAEIRTGDAMQTLKDVAGPVDLLFLDGAKELYLPVVRMMQNRLRPGSLVLADNMHSFPDKLKPYLDYVSRAGGPYHSMTLPFDSGLGFSLYAPD